MRHPNIDIGQLASLPHRRYDPLRDEWLLVSPHRLQRPWQGQAETTMPVAAAYDPSCYLCPGNARAGGAVNPHYEGVFVFDNDFPALVGGASGRRVDYDDRGLLVAESESGICRVVCFSPRHDVTLASMPVNGIESVVAAWCDEYERFTRRPEIGYVQIFENRGSMMGCSNPHPHNQIWATSSIPNEPLREQRSLARYRERHGRCLLCSYAELESSLSERVVWENESFIVVVPFWAIWPFETLVIAKQHRATLLDLDAAERRALAAALKSIAIRYDNLFLTDFPYSMGFHQAGDDQSHVHAHFYPPLLRSATIRKFMVGYEMLAAPQRDLTPEQAAARLRELSDLHFRETIRDTEGSSTCS